MNIFFQRFIKLLIGIFLFALGIVMTMKANLGFAPWEVFHWGIGKTIGMSIGNVSIFISLFICVIVVLMGEKLGLGTILNMILIGVFIDILLFFNFIPQMNGLVSGVVQMIAGLFTIAYGSYFYIDSGFGAGPRDSLMIVMRRKTKLPVGLCRGILEIFVVLIGWKLGGPIGIGTVIAAFGISFCIQIVFSLMRFEATSVKHETLDVTQKNFKALYFKKEG
ncbi:hypothetical protein [Petroclostridium sp. X23]|uniref:YczE/YyaS/YitT family protein n=1 Tax=Petroclostridium sp. X23 TaxID=3045146 RepID=UPI0024AE5F25|nr:hypothetical protein [Petroclostridium sp. X23]WHH61109.1 hypothetical protein QKW49_10550 [Petroclostridium sp. X23]